MSFNSIEKKSTTEIPLAVFGNHAINKKGELVSLVPSEQKGISKIGTSVLWHLGQLDTSKEAIEAYNARIQNTKHLHINVKIEEEVDENNNHSNNNNLPVNNDKNLIDDLNEAEKILHKAEKNLEEAIANLEGENIKFKLENTRLSEKLVETSACFETENAKFKSEKDRLSKKCNKFLKDLNIAKEALDTQKVNHEKEIADRIAFHEKCVLGLTEHHNVEVAAIKKVYEEEIANLNACHQEKHSSLELEIVKAGENFNKLLVECEVAHAEVHRLKKAQEEFAEQNQEELVNKLSVVTKAHDNAIRILEERNKQYNELNNLYNELNHNHAKIKLEFDLKIKNEAEKGEDHEKLHHEHHSLLEKFRAAEQTIENQKIEIENVINSEFKKAESIFKENEEKLKADLKSAEEKVKEYAGKFKRVVEGKSAHAITAALNLLSELKLHETEHGKKICEELQAKSVNVNIEVDVKKRGHKKKKVQVVVEKN